MMQFFTISTKSHLFKSKALRNSLLVFGFELKIIVIDGEAMEFQDDATIIHLSEIENANSLIQSMIKQYGKSPDKLRWSLKSAVGIYLLENGYEQVIYVDNDIHFFNSPQFLLNELNENNLILTPHHYKSNPENARNWLEANYRIGLYNAGFFGANQKAIPILEWWANCCLYEMKKSFWRGLYDDQKYLDLLPIIFDNVEIIKHSGCNLAGWNEEYFASNPNKVIFVHFANLTLEKWQNPVNDFHSYYQNYLREVLKNNPNYVSYKNYWSKLERTNAFYYLRWRITRFFAKK